MEILVVIAVYINDGLILTRWKEDIIEFLYKLQDEFEIIICDEVSQFLGFQIERLDNGSIKIHQTIYTLKMFNMSDCRSLKISVDKILLDILYEEKEEDIEHYVTFAIGRLIYFVVSTRLDLTYAER